MVTIIISVQFHLIELELRFCTCSVNTGYVEEACDNESLMGKRSYTDLWSSSSIRRFQDVLEWVRQFFLVESKESLFINQSLLRTIFLRIWHCSSWPFHNKDGIFWYVLISSSIIVMLVSSCSVSAVLLISPSKFHKLNGKSYFV